MDLSSALLENFSEYFVAANTRTSLTDFAESNNNSFDPISSSPNGNSLNNMNSQTNTSNSNHLGLSFDGAESNNSSPGGSLHKQFKCEPLSQPGDLHDQVPSNHDLDQFNHDLECNNNNSTTNHSNNHQQREYTKYSRNNRKSESYAHSSAQPRLSQPTRTQIPIHCLIEQIDNYTNISNYNYQLTLNDNDLFRTEDPMDPTDVHTSQNNLGGNSNNSSNNNNHGYQPHLHQSKLALESVTNGSSASTSIPTSNTSLFSNDATNNPSGTNIFERIDTSLDQLGPNSPLSNHQNHQLEPTLVDDMQQTSILDSSIDIRQDSYLDNNQQLSSCKETFVIVGSNTLYTEILPVILKSLGYSSLDIISAKGK